MALPEGQVELGLGAALVAFVTGFWAWMRTRATRKPYVMASDGIATAAKDLVDGAADLNADYRKQLASVREECAGLGRKVARLSRKVASCEGKHAACEAKTERQEAELEKLRRDFEAYTAKNPPATY